MNGGVGVTGSDTRDEAEINMVGPYFSDDSLTLLLGNARRVLPTLAAGSVNCVVTSPPYYGLRDYEGNPDQIGLEETPAEYVAALVEVFTAARRVLADDGTLWLNVGDTYSWSGTGSAKTGAPPAKNLFGIPWRVAFALQGTDWVLRNAIVWHKTNAKPESVTDRLSSRYEPLFLFSKSTHYSFDLDAIREPHAAKSVYQQDVARRRPHRPGKTAEPGSYKETNQSGFGRGLRELHEKGANPGDVWSIPTVPLKGAHFAPFPPSLARRCILAGSRPGGTVLDPFSGAGTTALAAQQLGRRAIGLRSRRGEGDRERRDRCAVRPSPRGRGVVTALTLAAWDAIWDRFHAQALARHESPNQGVGR